MIRAAAEIPPITGVPPDYRHYPKLAEPAADVALSDAYLKCYDVRREDAAIGDEVRDGAAEHLRAEAAGGRLPIGGELGFAILHRCGDAYYYLLVCTWRNANELWETVYARDADGGGPFELVPPSAHKPVACVWELAVVVHERAAWTRYLCSGRDDEARRAYVDDRYSGPA